MPAWRNVLRMTLQSTTSTPLPVLMVMLMMVLGRVMLQLLVSILGLLLMTAWIVKVLRVLGVMFVMTICFRGHLSALKFGCAWRTILVTSMLFVIMAHWAAGTVIRALEDNLRVTMTWMVVVLNLPMAPFMPIINAINLVSPMAAFRTVLFRSASGKAIRLYLIMARPRMAKVHPDQLWLDRAPPQARLLEDMLLWIGAGPTLSRLPLEIKGLVTQPR